MSLLISHNQDQQVHRSEGGAAAADAQTYIESPDDLVDGGLGHDEALKVDVVPLLDAARVEGLPQGHRHHGRVLLVKYKSKIPADAEYAAKSVTDNKKAEKRGGDGWI